MSEEKLQAEVVRYIQLQYPQAKYCASLGGIYSGVRGGIKAKRTGYQRGFPDLQICEARGGKFGLFIELKTLKGRATQVQMEWIDALNERGYHAEVCKGIDEIIKCIDKYMNNNLTVAEWVSGMEEWEL